MLDYPLVFVRKIEILPIPEVVDYWSEEAAKARLDRIRRSEDRALDRQLELHGINRTPEIALAYQSEALQSYVRALKSYEGQDVASDELAPQLEPDKYFKWAYPLPGGGLFVSLSEAESDSEERICQVMFHGKGPNLGSAGGPTLQRLGPVAAIHYEGRLLAPGGEDPEKERTDHSS